MTPNSSPVICIIVENEAAPADRRVWQEARAFVAAGFRVSIICPKGNGCESNAETLEGIEIYRYPSCHAHSTVGYIVEYTFALVDCNSHL